jgi:hypothetical protein
MALTQAEKKEMELIARKEIKDFFNSSTLKQYEDKILDMVAKELKRGKLESETKDIVINLIGEFGFNILKVHSLAKQGVFCSS